MKNMENLDNFIYELISRKQIQPKFKGRSWLKQLIKPTPEEAKAKARALEAVQNKNFIINKFKNFSKKGWFSSATVEKIKKLEPVLIDEIADAVQQKIWQTMTPQEREEAIKERQKENKIALVKVFLMLLIIPAMGLFWGIDYWSSSKQRPPEVKRGISLIEEKKFEEAIKELETAVNLYPQNYLAHDNLGYAYFKSGGYEEAVREFRTAAKIKPKDKMIYTYLGEALIWTGKPEEAMPELKNAIILNPDNPWPHYYLGKAYEGTDKMEEAVAEYKKTIKLDPKFEWAHINLGVLYQKENQNETALSIFKEGLENLPNSYWIRFELGITFLNLKRNGDYESEMRTLIQKDKQYYAAYFSLAEYYASLNKITELKKIISEYLKNANKTKSEIKSEINNNKLLENKEKILKALDEI